MSKVNKKYSNIIVEGAIESIQGHTDFKGTMYDAIELIMESAKAGKFTYLNAEPYFFERFDADEVDAAADKLAENPNFTITDAMVGGCAKKVKKPAIKSYTQLLAEKRSEAAYKAVATRRANEAARLAVIAAAKANTKMKAPAAAEKGCTCAACGVARKVAKKPVVKKGVHVRGHILDYSSITDAIVNETSMDFEDIKIAVTFSVAEDGNLAIDTFVGGSDNDLALIQEYRSKIFAALIHATRDIDELWEEVEGDL